SGDQKGLIAKLLRWAGRIYQQYAAGVAAVAPRKNVKFYASRFEEPAEQDGEGSLSRAAHAQIPYADDWTFKLARTEKSAIIQSVAGIDRASIDCAENAHRVPAEDDLEESKFFRAATVLCVAPICDCKVSCARRPSSARSEGLDIRSSKTNGSSAGPTIFTALRLWKSPTMSRKFSVWLPTMIGTPYCAGSIMLWPPRGTRLPPTKATSAKEYTDPSSPMLSSRKIPPRIGSCCHSVRRHKGSPKARNCSVTSGNRSGWRGARTITAAGWLLRTFRKACSSRPSSSLSTVLPATKIGAALACIKFSR